jgi:hypothetical protein
MVSDGVEQPLSFEEAWVNVPEPINVNHVLAPPAVETRMLIGKVGGVLVTNVND